MAFDISIDRTPSEATPPPASFDDFCDAHGHALATGLTLACIDRRVGAEALREALVKTSQQWKHVRVHPNLLGWALQRGIEHIDRAQRDGRAVAVNEATGGYVRGLSLEVAFEALPLHQRLALVRAHHLGWSDEHSAAGAGASIDRVSTLRNRATTFLAHHLHCDAPDAVALVTAHLSSRAEMLPVDDIDVRQVRNLGRRRTVRNRVGAALGVAAIIVAGAAAVQVGSSTNDQADGGPVMVNPPSNSSDWLRPVLDGRGGFVALNTAGASRFVRSSDGEDWFEDALWNSRSVNLQAEVSGFTSSGGRYLASLEAPDAIRSGIKPYVATSTDLASWTARQVELALPDEPQGLNLGFEVLSMAFAERTLLVAVDVVETIDYAALGEPTSRVCVEATYDALRALHLCDGEVTTIDRPPSLVAADSARLLVADGAGSLVEVVVPAGVDARSLVSDGRRFAATNALTGELLTSIDGQSWATETLPVETNRFALVEGDPIAGSLMTIVPSADGWSSVKLDQSANATVADLDLDLDPSAVWTKPELAVGPAGWALFVTTSRPWERVEDDRGWAVDTGTWVVSRLPDSMEVTAQNVDTRTTYRFLESSEFMQRVGDEGVVLRSPDATETIIEVTDADIERSRSATGAEDAPTAHVFYSPDGRSWRSIWQTQNDTWFGTVAVGDDEVLISGATLTGPPISVSIDR